MTARDALDALDSLSGAGVLADIDRHFALLLTDWDANQDVALIAAVASAAHRAGHTCLALGDCAGLRVAEFLNWLPRGDGWPAALPQSAAEIRLPALSAMRAALAKSDIVVAADEAAVHVAPLVLDEDRLYLRRLWLAEQRLAERLCHFAAAAPETRRLESVLQRLFPDADEARQTAMLAAARQLAIVTGGPGTGKTTLVVRLIALLLESGLASARRIALATPTGKAAARLQESVSAQLKTLAASAPALQGFTPNAITVHRLLSGKSPLRVDAVIVDECSMVDMALMGRLADALPDGARLIVLGDADQLASVRPGYVFSDICAAGNATTGALAGSVVTLTRSHRFRASGGIGQLAAAIVRGDAEAALAALADATNAETELQPLPSAEAFDRLAHDYARDWCAPVLRDLLAAGATPTRAFPALRVLCAHRAGPFGANRFNRVVERRLRQLVTLSDDEFYVGRPIIVTRNDRQTNLANGDTGVVVAAEGDGRQVWFPDLPGNAPDGRFLIAPSRLPAHESFFALTVHRAQGSEYDEVACVPGPAASRVNTRELLYTAVTRAKRKVTIFADAASVRACVGRATKRTTGLLEALARRT